VETFWELIPEVLPFQYRSDCLVSWKRRLYRNNGATFHYTITLIEALFLWGATAQMGQGHLIIEVSKPHTTKSTHTHIHTHSKTPLEQWKVRYIGRYLHNIQHTQNRISMLSVGLEPEIPGIKRLAAELGFRQHGQWHRLLKTSYC
jgi:hypothetical protein